MALRRLCTGGQVASRLLFTGISNNPHVLQQGSVMAQLSVANSGTGHFPVSLISHHILTLLHGSCGPLDNRMSIRRPRSVLKFENRQPRPGSVLIAASSYAAWSGLPHMAQLDDLRVSNGSGMCLMLLKLKILGDYKNGCSIAQTRECLCAGFHFNHCGNSISTGHILCYFNGSLILAGT